MPGGDLPSVSVIIPWRDRRDSRRSRIKDFVEARWCALFPTYERCEGTGPPDGPFNRAAALNGAARASSGDVLLLVDADTVLPRGQVERAVAIAAAGRPAIAYFVYYNLTPPISDEILACAPATDLDEPPIWEHRLTDSVSGCVVVPRRVFDAVGGFDERFLGWGGEDRAFHACVGRLCGAFERVEGPILHLWHPRDGLDGNDPLWQQNRRLEAAYLAATTRDEMLRVRFGKEAFAT